MNIKRELRKFEKDWAKYRPNDPFTPNGEKSSAWHWWQMRARLGK